MTEISYWRVLDIVPSGGEESMAVAISIPFKWGNALQMNARGIEEISEPTSKVDYYLNFIVVESEVSKYFTKNKVLSKLEKVLFNKDTYLGFFRSGQISIDHVNKVNRKVDDLFTYPTKIMTEHISIDEKLVHELLDKKFKKS